MINLVEKKFFDSTQKAIEKFGNGFCFSALYGSQNYGLDTPNSDVDIKVGFLPSPQDVLLGGKRQATTLTENGSTDNTILAKDLRDVFVEFYKQNLNFLEILVTPWFYASHEFAPIFNELRNNSNDVARYYERGFYLCSCGLFNKLNTDFERGRFDVKKFTFGMYLYDFVSKYHHDYDFKDCFESENTDYYKEVRSTPLTPELFEDYTKYWNDTKILMDAYFQMANNMSTNKNKYTRKWMDDLLYGYTWKYVVAEGT